MAGGLQSKAGVCRVLQVRHIGRCGGSGWAQGAYSRFVLPYLHNITALFEANQVTLRTYLTESFEEFPIRNKVPLQKELSSPTYHILHAPSPPPSSRVSSDPQEILIPSIGQDRFLLPTGLVWRIIVAVHHRLASRSRAFRHATHTSPPFPLASSQAEHFNRESGSVGVFQDVHALGPAEPAACELGGNRDKPRSHRDNRARGTEWCCCWEGCRGRRRRSGLGQ